MASHKPFASQIQTRRLSQANRHKHSHLDVSTDSVGEEPEPTTSSRQSSTAVSGSSNQTVTTSEANTATVSPACGSLCLAKAGPVSESAGIPDSVPAPKQSSPIMPFSAALLNSANITRRMRIHVYHDPLSPESSPRDETHCSIRQPPTSTQSQSRSSDNPPSRLVITKHPASQSLTISGTSASMERIALKTLNPSIQQQPNTAHSRSTTKVMKRKPTQELANANKIHVVAPQGE